MDRLESKETNTPDNRPSPINFDVYLPWACNQLQVEMRVVTIRVQQNDYVSMTLTDRSKHKKSKHKIAQSKVTVGSEEKEEKSHSDDLQDDLQDNVVRICAIYDTSDNLVQIKFDKNKHVPRTVLKIISLIVQFHIHLVSLTINRGLDAYSMHEICKILPKSHLTDICLDGTFLEDANYYLLLEQENNLRQISLARCRIDDDALKKLTDNLVYPLPSSKTLSVLNVSSNKITDVGAGYLAEALKTNRHLVYLNLADNTITDDGAGALLNILGEFPLSCDELISSRQRYMKYLYKKKEMFIKMIAELRFADERKSVRRKTVKQSSQPLKKAKGLEKEPSIKTVSDTNKSCTNMDTALFEKAESMALNAMGSFSDPFSKNNTVSKEGVVYCHGNNALAYLNLAYNNISYFSVKKLKNILLYQKLMDRKPRGLINLCVDGNPIPVACKELEQIDDILEMGLMVHCKRFSVVKKRPGSRGK